MNKLAVISMTALAAFIGWCGWLAYWCDSDNGRGLYAPNVLHKIQLPLPCPPVCGQEQEQVMKEIVVAATGWHDELQINGKQIVVSSRGNMLDPERHDMAHALARAEHQLTKTMP